MNKLTDILISTRTMAVLLFIYAAAMATATFVENDYGTPTAKALIYEAKWFELVMLLLILNFFGNIKRYRLWKREKWPILVFHLAFVILFIGGAITRYISYEGIMHIREGQTSNQIITEKNYFKIQILKKGSEPQSYQEVPYRMSPIHYGFQATYDYFGEPIKIKGLSYLQRKKDSLVADNNGQDYLHFVVAGNNGRENYYVKPGEAKDINGTLVTFNRPIEGAIEFKEDGGKLFIKTPLDANYVTMASQETGATKKDEYQSLALRSLYTIGEVRIVVPEGVKKGILKSFEGDKKTDKMLDDELTVEVQGPKSKAIVKLPVQQGNPNLFKQIQIDGLDVILGFGPKVIETPFALKLQDFVMETYPGSNSPSAYESHVEIIDQGKQTPYKIYMNHVLNYKGYKFFQASFDQDRQGTVLSVNHDYWGTLITYIGYFFLFVAMFVTFFWKGAHFWKLNKMLNDISKKRLTTVIALFLSLNLFAQKPSENAKAEAAAAHTEASVNAHIDAAPASKMGANIRLITPDEIIARSNISKEHADKFGYLLVQSFAGRIVPMNTQALDVLRKLYKKDEFKGTDGKVLDANQWFLSINTDTESWTMVPIIKIGTKGGEELKAKTKADADGYTSLMNLFPIDPKTGALHYVLENDYNAAFSKRAADQSNYDKEVIAVNERVQIFNEFFSGQFMRIIPVKNDPNHRWNSWLNESYEPDEDAQKIMAPYFLSVIDAKKNGNWAKADQELTKLQEYQQKWGKNVIPSQAKVQVEVLMNQANINFKLLIFYTFVGGLLMLLGFIELFKPSKLLNRIIKTIIYIGCVGYALHFLGLVGRWYISGHAPWSNGYEAIVFISWVGITAGLLLYRRSNALIPAAGFMVAVIMMGFAHGGSALDPQITPLEPVLKSYWLIVHVAVITSSYGFFALSMIISVTTLFFYIVANKKYYIAHHDTTLKELGIVSEMSLQIGLFALTVGNFLGGIWANESWGRYWSWDPKETWAFISIIVYAIVLHLRLVPGLRGKWTFHVATMFAFSSMVMTYFGVNYYLSGLHSYAKGDPVPVPLWVYLGLAFMIAIAGLSYYKVKILDKQTKNVRPE